MTSPSPARDPRGEVAAVRAERERLWSQGALASAGPWHAGALLPAGVLLYGGAGWLLDRWLGWEWLTPVGVVVGLAAALTSIWFRYGVDRSEGR